MATTVPGGGLVEMMHKMLDGDAGGKTSSDPYALTPENKKNVSEVLDKFLRVNSASRSGFEWGWFRNLCLISGAHDVVKLDGQVKLRPMPKGYPRTITNKFREKYGDLLSALCTGRVPIKHLPGTDDDAAHNTAEIGERLREVIYAEAKLDFKESEAAEWFIATGNVFFHPYYDYDEKYGTVATPKMACEACGGVFGAEELSGTQDQDNENGVTAPSNSSPATAVTPDDVSQPNPNPTTEPASAEPGLCPECLKTGVPAPLTPHPTETEETPIGALCVDVLSGFEVRGDMRIRDAGDWTWFVRIRRYDLQWAKEKLGYKGGEEDEAGAGGDGNTLAQHYLDVISSLNDQFNPRASFGNTNTSQKVPKVTGYELYMLPNADYPEGLCVTRVGKSSDGVVDIKPLDTEYGLGVRKGQKFLPLVHGKCSSLPGRLWGSTPLDDVVPLQYFRNRVERAYDAELRRMVNSLWMNPKGSGVDNFSGEAGQVITYNPIAVGGTTPVKPERVVPQLQYLQFILEAIKQIDDQIERVVGTYYVEGGESAPNVTAASALALLDQNKKKAMGPMVRSWAKAWLRLDEMTLEIARKYWTDKRISVAAGQNTAWEVSSFMNSDLQGAVTMQIDYQSLFPASEATKRAEIEQLIQGAVINPQDPEQKYEILHEFGLTKMLGSVDVHTKVAKKENDAFLKSGGTVLPQLAPMFQNSMIHIREHVLFGNTDEFKALSPDAQQAFAEHVTAHFAEEGAKRALMAQLQINPDAPGAVDITAADAQAALQGASQFAGGTAAPPQNGAGGKAGNQVGSRTPKGTTGAGPNQAKAQEARTRQVMTQPIPDIAEGASAAAHGVGGQ